MTIRETRTTSNYLLSFLAVTFSGACAVTPDPADSEGPEITLSEVSRGAVEVFNSTDASIVIDAPDQCPDGTVLIGTFWQVSTFPVNVLLSAADVSGVKWLRIASAKGVFSTPDPATVSITTRTVGGTEYSLAQMYYPDSDPRSARLFTVTVNPRPGETIVDLEGGARDFSDNAGYTYVTSVGTNEALCESN